MSDETNPNSLARPKVHVTTLNKKLLYVIIAVLIGLVIFLAIEVDRSTTKTQAVQEAQNEPEPPDNKPAVINPGKSAGLAMPEPLTESGVQKKVDTKSPDERQIIVVPTTTQDPAQKKRLQELERLRQLKWKQEQEAFTAPLRVNTDLPSLQAPARQPAIMPESIGANIQSRHPITMPTANIPSASGAYNPAGQKDKEAFLTTRSSRLSQWDLNHRRIKGSKFELKTGTLIPGIMLTGINSDLPGQLVGQVSQNVYDTASGDYLLIPQGSRMIGVYDSRVVAGQSRVLIAWNRIIFPDGSSITLGTMPGTDMAGYSGLADKTDNHYLKVFGSAAIMSLISGITSYAADSFSSDTAQNQKPTLQDELGSALSSQLGQTGLQVLQRNLSIQPTLTIRPGYRFNMVATKDIVFRQPYTEWR